MAATKEEQLNSAVKHFLGQTSDNKEDLSQFFNCYTRDILCYLTFLEESPFWLKVVFQPIDQNRFSYINQISQLRILSNQLQRPACFISTEPSTFNTSHFIFGMLFADLLVIINPLGQTVHAEFYETLNQVKQHLGIRDLLLSNTELQRDSDDLVSCGPLCAELMCHFSQLYPRALVTELKELLSEANKQGYVNLYRFLPAHLSKLLKTKNYQKDIIKQRLEHLQRLALTDLSEDKQELKLNEALNAPETILLNKLCLQQITAVTIENQPEYLTLLNARHDSTEGVILSSPGVWIDDSLSTKKNKYGQQHREKTHGATDQAKGNDNTKGVSTASRLSGALIKASTLAEKGFQDNYSGLLQLVADFQDDIQGYGTDTKLEPRIIQQKQLELFCGPSGLVTVLEGNPNAVSKIFPKLYPAVILFMDSINHANNEQFFVGIYRLTELFKNQKEGFNNWIKYLKDYFQPDFIQGQYIAHRKIFLEKLELIRHVSDTKLAIELFHVLGHICKEDGRFLLAAMLFGLGYQLVQSYQGVIESTIAGQLKKSVNELSIFWFFDCLTSKDFLDYQKTQPNSDFVARFKLLVRLGDQFWDGGYHEKAYQCYALVFSLIAEEQKVCSGRLPNSILSIHNDTLLKISLLKKGFANPNETQNKQCAAEQILALKKIREIHGFSRVKYQKGILGFLREVFASSQTLLGAPPCAFSILILGSGSRGELCFYSDVEFMLLVEDQVALPAKQQQWVEPYFRALIEHAHLQLLLLGETHDYHELAGLPQAKIGLRFDSFIKPFSKCVPDARLFGTVEEIIGALCKNLESLGGAGLAQLHAQFLYGDAELSESFQLRLKTRLCCQSSVRQTGMPNVIAQRIAELSGLFGERNTPASYYQEGLLSIKKLLQYSSCAVQLFNLFHLTIDAPLGGDTIEQINYLAGQNYISTFVADMLRVSHAWAWRFRQTLHDMAKGEQDHFILPILAERKEMLASYREVKKQHINSLPCLGKDSRFEPNLYIELKILVHFVWHPIYNLVRQQLSQQHASNTAELSEFDLRRLQFAADYFSESFDCVDKHELYQWISLHQPMAEETEVIRQIYIDAIQAHPSVHSSILTQELMIIPRPDGIRLSESEQYQLLLSLVEDVSMSQEAQTQEQTQVTLTAPDGKQYHLKPEVIIELFNTETYHIKPNRSGKHKVHDCHGLVFKEMPDHPGMSYAIDLLYRRLFGRGSAANLLFSCRLTNTVLKTDHVFPILISLKIPGSTLKEYMSMHTTTPTFAINPDTLTEVFLMTLLTLPGDAAPRNIILRPLEDDTFHPIMIDNEQMFTEPVLARSSKRSQLQLCSALLCLPQIREMALSTTVMKQVLSWDTKTILTQWLRDITDQDANYLTLFPKEIYSHLYNDDKVNPKCCETLFPEGAMLRLMFTIDAVVKPIFRQRLASNQTLLPIEVLRLFDAQVERQYYNLLIRTDFSIAERYERLSSYALIPITSQDAFKASLRDIPTFATIQERNNFSPIAARLELDTLVTETVEEDVFFIGHPDNDGYITPYCIDFSTILDNHRRPDLQRQQHMVERLVGLRIEKLALFHCYGIDDNTLKSFSTLPDIKYLDLRHCPMLTDKALQRIAKQCSKLENFYLNNSPRLKKFSSLNRFRTNNNPFVFAELKKLHLSNCPAVSEVMLVAPKLTQLKLARLPNLDVVKLSCPSLVQLDLRANPRWINIIENLLDSPELIKQLSFIDLRENDIKATHYDAWTILRLCFEGSSDLEIQIWEDTDTNRPEHLELPHKYYLLTRVGKFLHFFIENLIKSALSVISTNKFSWMENAKEAISEWISYLKKNTGVRPEEVIVDDFLDKLKQIEKDLNVLVNYNFSEKLSAHQWARREVVIHPVTDGRHAHVQSFVTNLAPGCSQVNVTFPFSNIRELRSIIARLIESLITEHAGDNEITARLLFKQFEALYIIVKNTISAFNSWKFPTDQMLNLIKLLEEEYPRGLIFDDDFIFSLINKTCEKYLSRVGTCSLVHLLHLFLIKNTNIRLKTAILNEKNLVEEIVEKILDFLPQTVGHALYHSLDLLVTLGIDREEKITAKLIKIFPSTKRCDNNAEVILKALIDLGLHVGSVSAFIWGDDSIINADRDTKDEYREYIITAFVQQIAEYPTKRNMLILRDTLIKDHTERKYLAAHHIRDRETSVKLENVLINLINEIDILDEGFDILVDLAVYSRIFLRESSSFRKSMILKLLQTINQKPAERLLAALRDILIFKETYSRKYVISITDDDMLMSIKNTLNHLVNKCSPADNYFEITIEIVMMIGSIEWTLLGYAFEDILAQKSEHSKTVLNKVIQYLDNTICRNYAALSILYYLYLVDDPRELSEIFTTLIALFGEAYPQELVELIEYMIESYANFCSQYCNMTFLPHMGIPTLIKALMYGSVSKDVQIRQTSLKILPIIASKDHQHLFGQSNPPVPINVASNILGQLNKQSQLSAMNVSSAWFGLFNPNRNKPLKDIVSEVTFTPNKGRIIKEAVGRVVKDHIQKDQGCRLS